MTKCLLIALCVFGSKISLASYIETSLIELVERATCILYGKIVVVEKDEFKVVVIRSIKSCKQNDTISIQKFNNWTCASRYSEYVTGQEGVFFLSSYKGELAPIGAANEGELIVKNDTGYVQSFAKHDALKPKSVSFIPSWQGYIPIRVQTIIEGIKIYLENREAIDRQFAPKTDGGTVAYQYDYTEKFPKNDFLTILIDQKVQGY